MFGNYFCANLFPFIIEIVWCVLCTRTRDAIESQRYSSSSTSESIRNEKQNSKAPWTLLFFLFFFLLARSRSFLCWINFEDYFINFSWFSNQKRDVRECSFLAFSAVFLFSFLFCVFFWAHRSTISCRQVRPISRKLTKLSYLAVLGMRKRRKTNKTRITEKYGESKFLSTIAALECWSLSCKHFFICCCCLFVFFSFSSPLVLLDFFIDGQDAFGMFAFSLCSTGGSHSLDSRQSTIIVILWEGKRKGRRKTKFSFHNRTFFFFLALSLSCARFRSKNWFEMLENEQKRQAITKEVYRKHNFLLWKRKIKNNKKDEWASKLNIAERNQNWTKKDSRECQQFCRTQRRREAKGLRSKVEHATWRWNCRQWKHSQECRAMRSRT